MSDASGSWGGGAVSDSGTFFQVHWPESWAQVQVSCNQRDASSCDCSGHLGMHLGKIMLLVRSDNMAVVHALSAGTVRLPTYASIVLPSLLYGKLPDGICARHISGIANSAADALSRKT